MKALLEENSVTPPERGKTSASPRPGLTMNRHWANAAVPAHNKPTMYIANVDEDGFDDNPHLDVVREISCGENAVVSSHLQQAGIRNR